MLFRLHLHPLKRKKGTPDRCLTGWHREWVDVAASLTEGQQPNKGNSRDPADIIITKTFV